MCSEFFNRSFLDRTWHETTLGELRCIIRTLTARKNLEEFSHCIFYSQPSDLSNHSFKQRAQMCKYNTGVLVLSHVWLLATPWTVALQAPLSMEFSRQAYWNGLPFLPPGDLPNPGIQPASLAPPTLADRFFTALQPGESTTLGIRDSVQSKIDPIWAPWSVSFLQGLSYFKVLLVLW